MEGLKTSTRTSSLFREIAAPPYFMEAEFEVPQPAAFWVSVHSKDCEALLLWQRTQVFSLPEHLFFDIMSATDRHLLALDIFFRLLPRHLWILTTVNLSCIGAMVSLDIVAPLLESIKGTGCPEPSYIGNNHSPVSCLIIPKNLPIADAPSWIQSFTAQSNIVFAKPVIPFTFSMPCLKQPNNPVYHALGNPTRGKVTESK